MNSPIPASFVRVLLPVLVLLSCSYASAQKATVRDETIYRNKTVYARVHISGTSGHPSFSFRTLAGREFMMMNYDDVAGDYRVVFFPGEEQTRLPARYGSLEVMAQEVVDNHLLENDGVNPAGIRRFMLAHPASASPGAGRARRTNNSTTAGEKSTSETLHDIDDELERAADDVSEAIINIGSAIERAFEKDSLRRADRRAQDRNGRIVQDTKGRDRAAAVTATGDELRQGGVTIGRYEITTSPRAGEQEYTFYSSAGETVAEAMVRDASPETATLTTRDNRNTTLVLKKKTQGDIAAEIAAWLVRRNYL